MTKLSTKLTFVGGKVNLVDDLRGQHWQFPVIFENMEKTINIKKKQEFLQKISFRPNLKFF